MAKGPASSDGHIISRAMANHILGQHLRVPLYHLETSLDHLRKAARHCAFCRSVVWERSV